MVVGSRRRIGYKEITSNRQRWVNNPDVSWPDLPEGFEQFQGPKSRGCLAKLSDAFERNSFKGADFLNLSAELLARVDCADRENRVSGRITAGSDLSQVFAQESDCFRIWRR